MAAAMGTTERLFCVGFYPWKNGYVRDFLQHETSDIVFVYSTLDARLRGFGADSKLVVWGVRESAAMRSLAMRHGVPIWRMEDGFLRSVGLGSDRHRPASLVLDRRGIYYDPTQPSDLEVLLETADFAPDELTRAAALREAIVAQGVSKYNVGDRRAPLPAPPVGRRVVLVPGQVEDDASIRLGTRDVRSNLELLRAVREARPDAFVIWKPHPDVVSGNRRGKVDERDVARYADVEIVDAPLPACLGLAHEVHTMTSLVGFEGLLRGLEVHAYGLPFYAGWGLTHDRHPHPRRTRRRSLDELTAATLLRYPMYLHPRTSEFTTPEEIVRLLREQIAASPGRPVRIGRLSRKLQKLENAVRGILDGL